MKNKWTRLFLIGIAMVSFTLNACGGGGGGGGGGGDDTVEYLVSTNVGSGGSVTPANSTVAEGSTVSFTVNPEAGYTIDQVSGCGGNLSNNTYTTGAITAACTVSATFVELDPTLVLSAEAGDGQVTLSWNEIGADRYDLIYSTDSAFDPANYSAYAGGTMVVDVASPHVEAELTKDTTYYFVVEARKDGLAVALSAKVAATPAAPVALVQSPLNDTGIDWWATGVQNYLTSPQPYYPGQDADHGRDAAARGGQLSKVGGGAAGFDFTKLDASGNELSAGAGAWSCVRDNHTGLIWEIKVDDASHLRHLGHTYTWYNSDSTTNGGNAGTADGGTCTGSGCDTQAFVQTVNAAGLCGAGDWRLPTAQELLSIVHNGRTSPVIDPDYFPNTQSPWFWSSSPYASYAGNTWYVNFYSGHVGNLGKSDGNGVRLVRAGQ